MILIVYVLELGIVNRQCWYISQNLVVLEAWPHSERINGGGQKGAVDLE